MQDTGFKCRLCQLNNKGGQVFRALGFWPRDLVINPGISRVFGVVQWLESSRLATPTCLVQTLPVSVKLPWWSSGHSAEITTSFKILPIKLQYLVFFHPPFPTISFSSHAKLYLEKSHINSNERPLEQPSSLVKIVWGLRNFLRGGQKNYHIHPEWMSFMQLPVFQCFID